MIAKFVQQGPGFLQDMSSTRFIDEKFIHSESSYEIWTNLCDDSVYLSSTSCSGLTLLLPHLLSQNVNWQKCKLRVFASGKKSHINDEKRKWVV